MRRWLALPVSVLGLSSSIVLAQIGTATLTGHVTDPSGAVVPGVSITCRSVSDGNCSPTRAYAMKFQGEPSQPAAGRRPATRSGNCEDLCDLSALHAQRAKILW